MRFFLKNIIERKKLSENEIEENKAYYRYGDNNQGEINYDFIEYYIKRFDSFEKSKLLFKDEESRDLFDLLVLYRSLGYKYIKLPKNTHEYQQFIKTVDKDPKNATIVEQNYRPIRHKFFNLYKINDYDINVIATNGFLINFLFNKQYEFNRNRKICVEDQDVVIDCGACYGDTTVAFAKTVGRNGKVFAFEFVEKNLEIFYKNLELNKDIKNITLVKNALDKVSNNIISFQDNFASTSLRNKGNNQVETITIDDVAEKYNLEKVDFIKMDIEGYELNALIGAKDVINKYKPKLAISLYHKIDDFITIPEWIKSNFPFYDLYLEHHTIHSEETVLYAIKCEKE